LKHAFSVLFLMVCLGGGLALAQTGATPANGILRGHVADPSGAMIPGAQVTVTTVQGDAAGKATTDSAGAYVVRNLAAGNYVLQAEAAGFAVYVSVPTPLATGQSKNFEIKMNIGAAQQQVQVTGEDLPTVNTEAESNSSAIVIKGSDVDALSDDPDELSNELSALAGPSAGPNGGQIYIDGFTGGQLPPKSAIREIRINQNPFSAEFDRLGYGRIEILTKPGTDTLHGRAFVMGNDDSFNTGNPFTKQIPSYYTIQGNASLSGSFSKTTSFNINVESRNNQDASIYTANTAVLSGGTYVPTVISGGLLAPQTRIEVSPRFDFQLGQKNTLTVRYQYEHSSASGNIGSTSLPTQNSSTTQLENTIQINDSHVINDHLVNEIRMQYRRSSNTQTAASTAPTVTVPNYFSSGGSGAQSSSGHNDHLELQDFVSMTHGAHAIKFGTWLRDNRQATATSSNFNGTFNFPSLDAYIATQNGILKGQTVAQIAANCPTKGACTPNKLSYTTGAYSFKGNLFDMSLFFQDDWKVNRFLTLSGGLRWESQNHVSDHNDFAPRVAFAYALDGHKNQKQAKTVLRGGVGFFYDRFQIQNLMNLEQYGGTASSQVQTVITGPTCFNDTSLQAALSQGCSTGTATPTAPKKYSIDGDYHSPYAETAGMSLERQLFRGTALTFTYLHYFGVHQMVVRNANAFLPGTYQPGSLTLTGIRPTSYPGIIDEYFPQAVFKQNQFMVNVNSQVSRRMSISGFYNYTNAKSNGGGGSNPSNSWNLSQDYGRAGFVRPQVLFLMSNYNGPWGIVFNPFLFMQAGRPYNITTTTDLTGDNFFNSRPTYASSSSNPSYVAQTSFGALDVLPQAGEKTLPMNLGTGPSATTFNLRVSRTFGVGPARESSSAAPRRGGQGGGPGGGRGPGGGGPGGGPGGGGFGGGGFGGGGGGFGGGGGGAASNRKYSLNFSVQALNLFNNINYGNPSGTVVPTYDPSSGLNGPGSRFGESTQLAGGMFGSPSGAAARRIFIQAAFQF
jgi:hypothetical protein